MICLLNILCVGELFKLSVSVLGQSSKAGWKSDLELTAFLMRVLNVLTAFSNLPLLDG